VKPISLRKGTETIRIVICCSDKHLSKASVFETSVHPSTPDKPFLHPRVLGILGCVQTNLPNPVNPLVEGINIVSSLETDPTKGCYPDGKVEGVSGVCIDYIWANYTLPPGGSFKVWEFYFSTTRAGTSVIEGVGAKTTVLVLPAPS
jgi:hypothetical protein